MPKVSVIVPNYNHAPYLERRLESILSQTYSDFELIILDDASADNSALLIEEYRGRPHVVDISINERNSGIPFAQWNKGVEKARGEYIWIAESDDYCEPILLEVLVGVLDRHPNVGLAYCQSVSVDSSDVSKGSLKIWTDDLDDQRWQSDYLATGYEECRNYLILKCTIPNASAVLFRRKIYCEAGGADETYRLSGDWMMWAKILLRSDIAFVSSPLNYFRTHEGTVRKNSSKSAIALLEAIRIVDYVKQNSNVSSDVMCGAIDRLLSRWVVEWDKGRRQIHFNVLVLYRLLKLDRIVLARIARIFTRAITNSTK